MQRRRALSSFRLGPNLPCPALLRPGPRAGMPALWACTSLSSPTWWWRTARWGTRTAGGALQHRTATRSSAFVVWAAARLLSQHARALQKCLLQLAPNATLCGCPPLEPAQKDPGEYLLELQRFAAIPDVHLRRHAIDMHLR